MWSVSEVTDALLAAADAIERTEINEPEHKLSSFAPRTAEGAKIEIDVIDITPAHEALDRRKHEQTRSAWVLYGSWNALQYGRMCNRKSGGHTTIANS